MSTPIDDIEDTVGGAGRGPHPAPPGPLAAERFGVPPPAEVALRRLRGENVAAEPAQLPNDPPLDLAHGPPAGDWLREDPLAGYYGRLRDQGRERLATVPPASRRGWILSALGVSLLGWVIATAPRGGRGDAAAGVHAVLHAPGALARDGATEETGFRRGAERAWHRLLQAADQQVSDSEARIGVAQEALEAALESGKPERIVSVVEALLEIPGGARDRRVRLLLAAGYRGLAKASVGSADRSRWQLRAREAAASAEDLEPTVLGEGWGQATSAELREAIRAARLRSGGAGDAETRGYTAALDAAEEVLSTLTSVARDAAPGDPVINL